MALACQGVDLPPQAAGRADRQHDPPGGRHAGGHVRPPRVLVDEVARRAERQRRLAGATDRAQLTLRRQLPGDAFLERIPSAHTEQLEERAARRVHARHRQPIVAERAEVEDLVAVRRPDGPPPVGAGVGTRPPQHHGGQHEQHDPDEAHRGGEHVGRRAGPVGEAEVGQRGQQHPLLEPTDREGDAHDQQGGAGETDRGGAPTRRRPPTAHPGPFASSGGGGSRQAGDRAEGDDGHPPPADVSGQPDGDDRAADDLHCGEATTFATQLGGSSADVDEAGRGRLDRRWADRPSRREAPHPERRRHDEGGRQRRLAEAPGDARRVQR